MHNQMSRLHSLTDAGDHARMEVPTLEQLRRSSCWWWVYCENSRCLHTTPMALTPLIIRWGAEASSDVLRRSARCARCGRRGATLQHPGHTGSHIGWMSFPTYRGTEQRQYASARSVPERLDGVPGSI